MLYRSDHVARPDSGYAASKHSGLTRAWISIPQTQMVNEFGGAFK